MLLTLIVITLTASPVVWSQRCNRDRLRQCQDSLVRSIQRRINDMNRSEMSAHCEMVRDDLNCLLQETRCLTSESERNRNGDTLRNTLKYLRDGCDTGAWRDSSCFVGEGTKTCESSFPLGGSQYASYNPETCRKFNLFQDCVMETIRNRCRPDDEKLLGQYLMDTAQDLAWNCGETSSSSDWGRSRDDRYRSSDRYGDRDRDRNQDRGYDRNGYRDRDRTYSRDGTYRDGTYRGGERDRLSDRYDSNRDGNDRYGGGYNRNYGSDITCCRNERCSSTRMQQCKDSLSRTIDVRLPGFQDSQKCRQTRDDFNCLLWQTSNCQNRNDRDLDNDIFRRARDYISRNCDSYGRWSENTCFKSSGMMQCENSLTNTRGGASFDSCRSFKMFRDCMQDELQTRCTREDDLYQGAYMVEKANELAWQCGGDQYGGNSGRDQYFTNDRRDRYGSDRYGDFQNPTHLEDDDEMCKSRIQVYADTCKQNLDNKRRDIYTELDYDQRNKITCCSARQYRSCLFDATRRVCQSDYSRVVDNLMGRFAFDIEADNCRRIYDADCDSCSSFSISLLLLFACLIIVPRLFAQHLL